VAETPERLGMNRAPYLIAIGVVVLPVGALAFVDPAPAPLLIWNATASTPKGLYALSPVDRLHTSVDQLRVGDLVVVRPPEPIASFLADGGFLPKGMPLLKSVAALPGRTVCRMDDAVTIDAAVVGMAKSRDHLGRPLPRWSGCHTLARGEIFLMNWAVPDSLDGRYFGPFPDSSIVATAVPLWTDEAGDGRFVRRASAP
jgi:conjugative transfer signal peptidase TraF